MPVRFTNKIVIRIVKVAATVTFGMIGFGGLSQSAKQSNYSSFAVFYDQDYTLQKIGLKDLNKDRNYTLGLGLCLTLPELKHSFLMEPHYALNRIIGKKRLNDRYGDHPGVLNSIMLGNGSFTPEDLSLYGVIGNDRPYASLTYLQTLIMVIDEQRFRQYTSTFSAGVIGLFVSREVQTAIHKSMNHGDTKSPRTPRGWNNQISNGGEPTLGYTYDEQRLLIGRSSLKNSEEKRFGLELKHGWKYSIGYYTMIDYGLNFRFGKIDPRNWTYFVNPLGSSNNLAKEAPTLNQQQFVSFNNNKPLKKVKNRTWELYSFGSLRPTFMLYNALLQGQFKESVFTLKFQEMRHLLLEFDGGLALSVPFRKNVIEIKSMISGRSPEFELPGRAPRWHFWGGIHIIVSHVCDG